VAALNMLLNDIDQAIVLEHWSGNADLLAKVKEILGRPTRWSARALRQDPRRPRHPQAGDGRNRLKGRQRA